MVTLSARIEDPTIQKSLNKRLRRRRMTWRLVWLLLLLLMIAAGAYGFVKFREYGQQKVQLLLQEGQQAEEKLAYTEALNLYSQATALGTVAPKGAAQAAYRAAALYISKSNYIDAQARLRDAERLDDSVAEYPATLGRTLLITRAPASEDMDSDLDEAEQAFSRVLALDNENIEAVVGKARLALVHGDAGDAQEVLEKSSAEANAEARLLLALLTIHDSPDKSKKELDDVRAESDNQGIDATAAALASVADQLSGQSQGKAYDYTLVGAALIEHNELDLARIELTVATEVDDEFRDGWADLAQADVLLGYIDDAQSAIDVALELDPTHGFSRFVLGQIAHTGGDIEGAVDAFEQAIEQRYLEPQAFIALAESLVEQATAETIIGSEERYSAAIDVLESALDQDVESDEIYDTLFWYYSDANRSAGSVLDLAERYADFDDRGTTAQGLLALAQIKNGLDAQARETVDELVARDPLSSIGAYILGVLDNDPVLLQKAIDLDQGGRVTGYAQQALDGILNVE